MRLPLNFRLLAHRPIWWWSVLILSLVLLFAGAFPGPKSTAGYDGFGFTWDQRTSGEWVFNSRNSVDQSYILDFTASFVHEHGEGWDQWTASPTTVRVRQGSPVPSPDVPQSKLDSLAQLGWQKMIDATRAKAGLNAEMLPGFELARDLKTDRVTGAAYYSRTVALTLGCTLFVVALVVIRTRPHPDQPQSGRLAECC
jgi:hypothetical protein